jgi:hypothetical protein
LDVVDLVVIPAEAELDVRVAAEQVVDFDDVLMNAVVGDDHTVGMLFGGRLEEARDREDRSVRGDDDGRCRVCRPEILFEPGEWASSRKC